MCKQNIKLAFILLLFVLLNACATLSGTPKSPLEFSDSRSLSYDSEDIINAYAKEFAQQATKNVKDKNTRDALISKALIIMDVRYAEFINDIETGRKNKEMFTDLIELSTNIAATAVGAAGTKTILSAISAGVNGINGSIDTNYFYEKTFSSLIAQMNADRKEVLVTITQGMMLSIEKYQWQQAVHDLVDYYNAGTLLGAISSIQKDAGAKQTTAENRIDDILMVSQVAKETDILDRKALTLSLNNISDANLDKVKSILVPLSMALSNLPACEALATKESSDTRDVKKALRDCIQSVSEETNRSFKDDNAEIAKRLKEVGILQQ